MDSVLEVQRQTHEDVERLERALTDVLARNPSSQKDSLANQQKAAQILDRIQARHLLLLNQYKDDARKAEIDLLSAPAQQDDLSDFYARLVKIKDHYRKYPDSVVGGVEIEIAALLEDSYTGEGDDDVEEEDPMSLLFSGEEFFGRYLDLHTNHSAYNNLRNLKKRLPYLQYLDVLAASDSLVHSDLPKEIRRNKDYETYIAALHSYLLSFTKRTQPLTDVEGLQEKATEEFEALWGSTLSKEWETPIAPQNGKSENGHTDGIWCAACQKLYSKQTVYDAHLTSKKHVKATERLAAAPEPPVNPNGPDQVDENGKASPAATQSKFYRPALLTYLTTSLLVPLKSVISDTKANVERRFALTSRERELELTEPQPAAPAASTAPVEEEDEEERIYNPLKLPLGWDGKPIPYWLYKLHGLGVEYRCEICSDHVYMGRKNFERHFQESRHAFGMRALGLPNTKHFHEITKIEDALSLAEKLKQEGRTEISQLETTEELEDSEGNVYNRKTYEDLKKQGLI
ncbi:hypothetical protein SISNIDRAFT_477224 [Sistotremastrum niveocremeum HHB9708]|uniref:U1-type domain-containing protein n=1 Tax=Sistotremastrum niveocremeum HHB9708 TaxID=1314777 RepID=A0A164ZMW3_9AGAM|nr:hypothetical protein SISNIDRAFT_477224 [Sistotremastrum niveocremeum HHB9708]